MTESFIGKKNLYVNVKQFNSTEIKILIQFLENKFKLDKISVNNNLLEFNSNNISKIKSIIQPYVFSSMKFKFII